jgi:transposase
MAASAAEACSEKAAYWSEHIAAWHRSGLSKGHTVDGMVFPRVP